MTRATNSQQFQNEFGTGAAPDHGRVVHSALVDRDNNILGCIDRLAKNVELIRLDGGVHWSTWSSGDALLPEAIAS